MKRQAADLETHLVTARQEIGRLRARGAELEERCHTREQVLHYIQLICVLFC